MITRNFFSVRVNFSFFHTMWVFYLSALNSSGLSCTTMTFCAFFKVSKTICEFSFCKLEADFLAAMVKLDWNLTSVLRTSCRIFFCILFGKRLKKRQFDEETYDLSSFFCVIIIKIRVWNFLQIQWFIATQMKFRAKLTCKGRFFPRYSLLSNLF